MKRPWNSKLFLIALLALAMAVALAPDKPAAGSESVSAASGGISAANSANKAGESIPAGLRLFYASHSLMWEVPPPLGEAANAYGIKDHVLAGLQSMGFSRTQQQWDQGTQAKQALQTGKVDGFIMSPMDMPDKGVENFVLLGLQNNPNMRFFVQNNWAGFNDDGQKAQQNVMQMMSGRLKPWDKTTEEDLKTLNTVCEKAFETQVKQINENVGRTVLFIIPTSQANSELRARIIRKEFPGLDKQSQLFLDQIGHPTPPLVTLNMYLHFATIYGRSPVGLPIPTVLKKANNPKWDENCNKALQELAWKTVAEYPYSGVKAPASAKQ